MHNNIVKKQILHILSFVSFFIIFLLFMPTVALASKHASVLGVTSSAPLAMPPTADGPGIFLPDSHFFFLDEMKQNIRLLLSFNHEEKAKTYQSIASERFAELRYMLARNNRDGIMKDLQGIAYNMQQAADEVGKAEFNGNDTKKLAKDLNDDIKSKQKVLDQLASAATGETKVYVLGASTSLFDAKMKVESSLDPADSENELRDDLRRVVIQQTEEYLNASRKAQQASAYLDSLTKEDSKAATGAALKH